MSYEAIYMPGDGSESDPSKKGFLSEDEAWEYVISRSCDGCKEEGIFSMCAAEWEVDEEE